MKSRACTRCRQWKVRCDAAEKHPQGCTRCQSLDETCVSDVNFKRISKTKRLLEMQAEIDRLRQAAPTSLSPVAPARSQEHDQDQVIAPSDNSQQRSTAQLTSSPGSVSAGDFLQHMPPVVPTIPIQSSPLGQDRVLGEIRLTASQISDLFQFYLDRMHPYLPFTIDSSIERLYAKCPLLVWIICAVATPNPFKVQFKPHITSMISEVHSSNTKSVEMIQALLIICMWPFPFCKLADDLSFFYSGLASQLGLQLGLHRSMVTHIHEHGSERPDHDTDQETRMTTWLACFIVNQMQASYRGVPPSVFIDFVLLSSFNHPRVSPTLSRLCHIAHLHTQSTLAIGAQAPNMSGLIDEPSRTSLIKLFGMQFSVLKLQHLSPSTSDIERFAFLTARLHLWSFALLDEPTGSGAQHEILQQAEADAIMLIELGCAKSLSTAPFHVSRSVIYSALALIKIIQSSYAVGYEVLLANIERARLQLGAAVCIENDILAKACTVLQQLPFYKDKRATPRIHSRLTASIVYDSLRVYSENQVGGTASSVRSIDLDGFDWNSFLL